MDLTGENPGLRLRTFRDWVLASALQLVFFRGWGWRTDPRFFWTGLLFGRRPPARADSRDTFGTHPDEANRLQPSPPNIHYYHNVWGFQIHQPPLRGSSLVSDYPMLQLRQRFYQKC